MDQQCGVVWRLISILIFHAYGVAVKVDIWPKNPLIATGGSIIINCSVTRSATEDTVNQPYFVFNDSLETTYSTFQVVQLNFSLVQLYLTNAQRHMSGLIECQLNESSTFISDSAFLTVADMPRRPNGSCRVYNWDNMTCSWAAQNDNGIPTNVSLYFNREFQVSNDNLYHCPHYDLFEENSCSWLKNDGRDSLRPYTHHWIILSAKNQLGSDYRSISLYPSYYVQPASVNQLRCHAYGSQSGKLSWISPRSGEQLFYRVKYNSSWNETKILDFTSKDSECSLILRDLSPNTAYWVNIDCIPLVENRQTGFWSESQTCQFSTKVDVPALAPPVTAGGYRVLNQRKLIELFWQPLSKRWANGDSFSYRIRIYNNTEFTTSGSRQTSTGSANSLLNSGSQSMQNVAQRLNEKILNETATSMTFRVNEDSSYWVTVEANTSAGFNESLVLEKVIIPSKNSVPLHPDMYTVTTNSHEQNHFYFNWSAVPMATRYTIYWCNRGQNQPNYCEWETVESSLTTHHLHLPNRTCEGIRFEFSVEFVLPSGKTVSTGMKPFDAIYFKDGEIRLPEDIKISDDLSPNSQIIAWKIPENEYCQKYAYISHFVIRICSATCYERIVDGSKRSIKLDGLSTGETYSIQLKSRSYDRESEFISTANISIPSPDAHRPVAVTEMADLSLQDSNPVTTIAVVTCSSVTVTFLIFIVLCYQFYFTSKNTIKIVIPKKLSLSKVEINIDSSASYTSQFVSDNMLDVNGCCNVSDMSDFRNICDSWTLDQITVLRRDLTNSSKAAENANKFSFMHHARRGDAIADCSPQDLPDYHQVMLK